MNADGCVAYLFGAGTDVSFDIELAHMYPRCQVFTIDPTPGLAERLSSVAGMTGLLKLALGLEACVAAPNAHLRLLNSHIWTGD